VRNEKVRIHGPYTIQTAEQNLAEWEDASICGWTVDNLDKYCYLRNSLLIGTPIENKPIPISKMICQWDSKFASLPCLWSIFERFPCSICGLSDDLLDGSFPDPVHSITGAWHAIHFWVDYAMQSDDYHASAPPPDAISFSKHRTHFMSHFLTTSYRPVSRSRNNSNCVQSPAFWPIHASIWKWTWSELI
jgi:hypothetical protein